MDRITLMGAEQVQSAGHSMRAAAEQMSRAAASMDDTFRQQRQFLEDWLMRFESILAEHK